MRCIVLYRPALQNPEYRHTRIASAQRVGYTQPDPIDTIRWWRGYGKVFSFTEREDCGIIRRGLPLAPDNWHRLAWSQLAATRVQLHCPVLDVETYPRTWNIMQPDSPVLNRG